MRSNEVFGAMSPEQATALLTVLSEKAPGMYASALHLAATAMRARPVYLRRQPFEKQAISIRRALARATSNGVAEEILAIYFLECRKELLVEWLDLLGIEHEDGVLTEDEPAAPTRKALEAATRKFLGGKNPDDRVLLLRAFAAQDSIDWPDLEALLPD